MAPYRDYQMIYGVLGWSKGKGASKFGPPTLALTCPQYGLRRMHYDCIHNYGDLRYRVVTAW